jgi:hypothetical protein
MSGQQHNTKKIEKNRQPTDTERQRGRHSKLKTK